MVLNLTKGTIVKFATGLGIVGNIFVLMKYICLFRSAVKSVELILIHLTFTNIITLLTKVMIMMIYRFVLINLMDDVGCNILIYLNRVTWGLSICTNSLLTVVQAITISPRTFRWRRLQPRSAWNILPLLFFFWILNSLISMNLPFYIKHVNSLKTSNISKNNDYYYFESENRIIRWIFIVLMVLCDTVLQGVMGWTSGYMVFLLHKHHQHVLYLQTSKLLYRIPPEMNAAQSVLLLMLCFLFFYWTDCFTSLYLTFSLGTDSITNGLHEFLTIGYAIVSPFLQIHREGHFTTCWFAQ
ncbi:putative vomeronasal receptor-like protein 4 [Sciurus carolinensis]|uniref:putative vomeronasal receptor-like protein 4 n=1 Tax=Sciurus carolinensis TaxID=30640 RepID=UPI001FB3ACBF|nr:putative vomeronasal receptor-like protein 4 [Sciurus carolinensis]